MRSAHQDAEEDHLALRHDVTPTPNRLQTRQNNMLENMGLEDPDDAVQYAMMLSMEEANASGSGIGSGSAPGVGYGAGGGPMDDEDEEGGVESDGEAEALEAVRKLEEAERKEREEVLEVVRRAEMRGE